MVITKYIRIFTAYIEIYNMHIINAARKLFICKWLKKQVYVQKVEHANWSLMLALFDAI